MRTLRRLSLVALALAEDRLARLRAAAAAPPPLSRPPRYNARR